MNYFLIKHTGGHSEKNQSFLIFRFDKTGATSSGVRLKKLPSSIL